MSKRKLNHQQIARIKKNQQKRQAETEEGAELDETAALGAPESGLVICRYAKEADVEDDCGKVTRCVLRQNIGTLTSGDRVLWCPTSTQKGVILSRLERTTVLGRPDKKGNINPVAANLEQILIVVAPKPELSSLLLDSYLVAAETLGISPIILFNKADSAPRYPMLKNYQQIGYPLICSSVKGNYDNETLITALCNKSSAFVGQSGVGKSSLIQWLIPKSNPKTSAISTQSQLGKHTTSNSILYHLPFGGDIIDSPGIRTFSLWHLDKEKIIRGFIECRPFIGKCKFKNCTHIHEPECAIAEAAHQGLISSERLKNLRTLLAN